MKLGKLAAAVAALSLTTAPAVAQATSASSSVERVAATKSSDAKLEGQNGILIAILAAAAVIAGIIIIADGDDDPTSP